MIRHWRFQPKLTLLYSVLFLVIFIPAIIIVQAAVVNGVTRSVERELQASGAVFNRILDLRGSQLAESADVLSSDFGFRAAVATQDAATVHSALANIADRVGASRGFVVDLDGVITTATHGPEGQAFSYADTLMDDASASSIGVIGERPHLFVTAPIRAPLVIGWIVFALELDDAATSELEALSPVQIQARILHGAVASDALHAQSMALSGSSAQVMTLDMAGEGEFIANFVPLSVSEGSPPITLVLTHALEVAFQPYRRMFAIIIALGLVGMALLAGGSWFLADRVTRPLAALTQAVNRLKDGRRANVKIETQDEFADLAKGFNRMSEEITAREAAITHMAMHDAETGLPNRRQLVDQVAQIQGQGCGELQRTLLIGIRLKRFAQVRAAIGYGLAAEYLTQIADRLRQQTETPFCARLTVNTLAVFHTVESDTTLEAYGQALADTLNGALCLEDISVDVNVLVGMVDLSCLTSAPDHALQTLELVLDHAEARGVQAMVYDPDEIQDPAENLSLMSDMRASLEAGHIQLHYQPKVDTRTGQITEVEALLRWTHPQRGFVPPDLFVKMAEETGHIAALSEWVVDRAIADQQAWAADGLNVKIGVNMSGRLLASPDFTDFMLNALSRSGLSAERLVLEITETAVMDDPETARVQLERLRNAGFALSIDDYGTGLSSLSYLKQLPVTELKIDKSFVLDLARNEQDRLLVRSTTDLAHSLGLKVTAEGVEDAESFAALQMYGCDYAQGYFISKAIPADTFSTFARDWNSRQNQQAPDVAPAAREGARA